MSRLVRRWTAIIVAACILAAFYSNYQWKFFRISTLLQKSDAPIAWNQRKELYPVETYRSLPTRPPISIPSIQASLFSESEDERKVRLQRQKEVKAAFVKSYSAYKTHAWLQDEVTPISGGSRQTFGGWGATLVDSLDSLWILGMKDDFAEAAAAVQRIDFTRASHGMLNVFETTIRYLGGLLSAYDLSEGKYPILLQKATELGDMLYAAFDTPNRMPMCRWYWENSVLRYPAEAASVTLSAEIGSLTLEFTRLSQLTGDAKYFDAIQRISDELERQQDLTALPGLWPITFDAAQLDFTKDKTFTLGGMADSLYEYIPKQYLMLGGAISQYGTMYEKFAVAAEKHIFFRPMIPDMSRELLVAGTTRKTAYEGDFAFKLEPEGQHLTCFLGGLYGIGSRIFNRPEDLVVAKKLVDGCVWAYEVAPNGIAPEIFRTWPCKDANHCPWNETEYFKGVVAHSPSVEAAAHQKNEGLAKVYIDRNNLPKGFTDVRDTRYVLRPEAIESVFVLYRITGDRKYQDIAWKMFTAIKKATETELSFAALANVMATPPSQVDSQESFWMAETLKYFYLIFSEPELISLDDYVLNTEAHPLKRPRP